MCEDEKLTGFVKNVADAIREVEGSSDQIRPVDFPERIKNLSSSSSSGFVYNVNTVNETSVPTADLEKLKSDPNAMIIETYTIAPVNFKIYYRKMFKSGDTYDRFVSVYSTANEEHINQTTLRAYRDLNYATSTLSKKRTVNIVNEDQLAAYLRRPTDNPTKDSLVAVSSNGGISWQPISDIKVPIIEIPAASTTITQEQANIIINNKDVTILYGTTQKIIYRKFTEYELTTTHLAYFVQFGGANPDAAQKIKQLVLTVDLNNLTVSRVELEIPRVSFITGTDEDANDVVLQTKFAKEVFDTPAVKANPTLKGTEEELTALQVGVTKYKVPSGGSFEGEYDRSIQIGKTAKAGAYSVAIGELSDSVVTLNPIASQALAIGYKCSEKHGLGVVIGYDSQSGAQNQTIIGYNIKGTNAPAGAIIIGTYPSGIDSSDKVVLGYGSTKYFNVKFVNGSFVANVAGKQLAFLEEVKPADNPTEDSVVKVSSTGSPSWQPVNDFLARPTSAANSDRVCIVPDGQTEFGYKNAYKTVYNVENVFVIRDVRGTVPQPDPQREQDGVNLRYLQANYNANPTLDGTEAELTGVTLNGTKYKVPSGGGGNHFKVQTFTINADDITATGSGDTIAYTLTESCLAPLKEGCLNAGKNGYLFATTEYNAVVEESTLFGKLYTLIGGFYIGDTASILTLQMVDSSGISGKEVNLISGRFSAEFKNDVETIKNAGGTFIIKIFSI